MPSSENPAAGEAPARRQRVAAYAVLLRDGAEEPELLLTRMSSRTRIAGRWTLPGGGLDHGEDPREAVRREVLEETGLLVEPVTLLDVHSVRFTGPRPDGLVEDYHGIHLLFSGRIAEASLRVEPHVVEEDSSTDLAAWLPLSRAAALDLLGAARRALELVEDGVPVPLRGTDGTV